MNRRTVAAAAGPLAAGALVAASVPPVGLWPLGIVGLGLWSFSLRGCSARRRLLWGFLFGLGWLVPAWWWMTGFTGPGYPVAVVVDSLLPAAAGLVTPPGRGHVAGFAAAVTGAALAKDIWPFGGVPISDMALGQAGGPLLGVARLGGSPLVTGAAALAGAGLAGVVGAVLARRGDRRGPWTPAGSALGLAAAAAVAVVGAYAPDGGAATASLPAAAVQGGGVRGVRAIHADPEKVFEAQLSEQTAVRTPVGLVLWPENVVELSGPLDGSAADAALSDIASSGGFTLVAGVTQPYGATQFLNQAWAWGPDGRRLAAYEKVHRVPFGEWIPFRGLLSKVANLSDVPRDEVIGHGANVLPTPAGRLGVMISYEVFFDDRALSAARAGATVLLVPTNASSYRTDQVPSQEVAAARLRAVEVGRDLLQAAPTGFSALVDHRGVVEGRSSLGVAATVQGVLHPRRGRTWFSEAGLWPARLWAAAGTAGAWAWALRWRRRPERRRRAPRPGTRTGTG